MTPLALLSRLIAIPPVLDTVARDAYTPPGARLAQRHAAHTTAPAGVPDPETALPDAAASLASTLLTRTDAPVRARTPMAALPGKPSETTDSDSKAAPITTRLSQTAHLLGRLLAHAQPQSQAHTPVSAIPLLPVPPPSSTELAHALRTALTRSGLFYESHLADWSLGHGPLDGLMQEPQNRLPAMGREPSAMPGSVVHGSDVNGSDVSGSVVHNAPASLSGSATLARAQTEQITGTTIPAALHNLVSNQLQLLESPTVLWRGDLWPGQALDWVLHHQPLDDDPARPHADPDTPVWTSRLKLTLPRLGEIDFTLHWNQTGQLQVAVAASNPLAEQTLQAARPQVHSRLTQAGCNVTAIKVSHDPG